MTFQETYTPISPHAQIATPIIEQEYSGSYLGNDEYQEYNIIQKLRNQTEVAPNLPVSQSESSSKKTTAKIYIRRSQPPGEWWKSKTEGPKYQGPDPAVIPSSETHFLPMMFLSSTLKHLHRPI